MMQTTHAGTAVTVRNEQQGGITQQFSVFHTCSGVARVGRVVWQPQAAEPKGWQNRPKK